MSTQPPEPRSLGPEISTADTLLWRQVFPTEIFVQGGRVTSAVFMPKESDGGLLSVTNGCMASAADAYSHYTVTLQSCGVWAVSVGECLGTSLKCFEDPRPEDPAHAAIDFRGLSSNQAKAKARVLSKHANARGRVFPP